MQIDKGTHLILFLPIALSTSFLTSLHIAMCPSSPFLLTLACLYVHKPYAFYPCIARVVELLPTLHHHQKCWDDKTHPSRPVREFCGLCTEEHTAGAQRTQRLHTTKTPHYSAAWRHWSACPPAVSLSGLSICCQPHGSRVITHYYLTFTFLISNEFEQASCFLAIWVSLFCKLPAPIFSLFFYWRVGFFLLIFFLSSFFIYSRNCHLSVQTLQTFFSQYNRCLLTSHMVSLNKQKPFITFISLIF